MLSHLERLVAVDAIKTMRVRFYRALDARDWDALASMVTEDIKLFFANESGSTKTEPAGPVELRGRENFLAFVSRLTGAAGRTIHVATMPEIEVHSADKARGLWLVQGYSENAREDGQALGIGYEKIEDDYVRVDGQWRIESLNVRIQAVL